jgi:glutamyl-tRNA reductase
LGSSTQEYTGRIVTVKCLYNLDDLQTVVDMSLAVRQAEVARAEAIAAEELLRFWVWLRTQEVAPTITALRRQADLIRSGELELLRARLGHLSSQDFQDVEAALRATVNKLLHHLMVHLRSAAPSGSGYHEIESIRTMFALDAASTMGRRDDGLTMRLAMSRTGSQDELR